MEKFNNNGYQPKITKKVVEKIKKEIEKNWECRFQYPKILTTEDRIDILERKINELENYIKDIHKELGR